MPNRYTIMPEGSKSRSDGRERVARPALTNIAKALLTRNSGTVHINEDEHESMQSSVASSKV